MLDTDTKRTGEMVKIGVFLAAGPQNPEKALEAKTAYDKVLRDTERESYQHAETCGKRHFVSLVNLR